jgi:hypothetical protein
MESNNAEAPKAPGFKPLKDRVNGKTIFLKVFPAIMKANSEFSCRQQRWICEDDMGLVGNKVYSDYFLAALTNHDEKARSLAKGQYARFGIARESRFTHLIFGGRAASLES